MRSPVRFAVIGCGRMGRRRMKLIDTHPESQLAAVVDLDARESAKAAGDFRCDPVADWQELPRRDDIDAVYVSVPNKWHAEMAIALLDAGKHVICEKPLARNPEEAYAMLEAAGRSRATLKCLSNVRYFPNVRKAYELFQAGRIGEPLFLRGWIGHGGWTADRWYGDREIAGGGTFLDNGCHLLDLARWFMGEVQTCVGSVQTALWPTAVEDNGIGIFETVEGKTATLHASWTEWNGYLVVEIYGSEGYLRVDSRGTSCVTALGDRTGKEEVFDFSALPPSSYEAEFADYMRCLAEQREPAPDAFDGLRAVEMAHAVYESARTGRRVELPARQRMVRASHATQR